MSSKKCTLQNKQQKQVLNYSDNLNKLLISTPKNFSTTNQNTTTVDLNNSLFDPLAFYRMCSSTDSTKQQQQSNFFTSFQSLLNNYQNNINNNNDNNINEIEKNMTLNNKNNNDINNKNYAAILLQAAALAAASSQSSMTSSKEISMPLFSLLKNEDNKQNKFLSNFDYLLKPTINNNNLAASSTNILQQTLNNQLLNSISFNNENSINPNQLKTFLHQQQLFQV